MKKRCGNCRWFEKLHYGPYGECIFKMPASIIGRSSMRPVDGENCYWWIKKENEKEAQK